MLLNNLLFYTLHILFLFGRMPLFIGAYAFVLLGRMRYAPTVLHFEYMQLIPEICIIFYVFFH